MRLFRRLPHGVQPTAEGERFRTYVERIFGVVQEMSTSLRDDHEVDGHLAVGVACTLIDTFVAPVLRDFQRLHPEVRLSARSYAAADVARALQAGEVDAGVVISCDRPDVATGGWVDPPGLVSEPLSSFEMVPVSGIGPKASEGARSIDPSWTDPMPARVLVVDAMCPSQRVLVEEFERVHGTAPSIVEIGSVQGVREAVQAGFGVAMLPAAVAYRAIGNREIEELRDFHPAAMEVRLLWHGEVGLSRSARRLCELIRVKHGTVPGLVGATR